MTLTKAEAEGVAEDVDAVTDALPTASRLLVVLHARGPQKVTTLAESLGVYPSSATRAMTG